MAHRFHLRIPRPIHDAMMRHAGVALPKECCGLLAGAIRAGVGVVSRHFPLVNASATPTFEYLSDPHGMLEAEKAMRSDGLATLAVYHSHPTSPAVPSRKDVERNAYGDSLIHLIISLRDGQPVTNAWWIHETGFDAGQWEIAEDAAIG